MKYHFLVITICIEFLIIICISVANLYSEIGFAIFYNIFYGIILSTLVPLIFLSKNQEDLSTVGIKQLENNHYIILCGFILFSIGGQLIPLLINNIPIRFNLLPICILPLIMTTFFEEFLFRGFIQTRIEKQYGYIVAILLSGLLFSLYHIGYPGFRNFSDLLLLFAVGVGFSIAYKLSNNNLFVSYFVNLPNALLTYLLKSEQFPVLTKLSSIFAGVTIILIIIILTTYQKREGNKYLF